MAKIIRTKTPQFKKLKIAIQDIENRKVKVGFFDTKYPDGTPVAYVAAIQEFGSPAQGIPPRSFMRTTIEEKKEEWSEIMRQGSNAIVNGNTTVDNVLNQIGLLASAQIGEKITQITKPPLAPATIRARQRKLADGKNIGNLTKPLIETGLLLQSPTHQVE